ncbi:hypothetical protein C8J56DRAFT_923679 [Mycena floridula]|nr:hypothetical protein C8J56DRAFT_923679 [Mycena floridula]
MSVPRNFRSRMGGVMRRTSSVLSITRPSPPHSDSGSIKGDTPSRKQSDASSIKQTDASSIVEAENPPTLAPVEPVRSPGLPSPIAESPAREAAASVDDLFPPKVPVQSPLSQEVVPVESPPAVEPVVVPAEDQASSQPAVAPADEKPPMEPTVAPVEEPTSTAPAIVDESASTQPAIVPIEEPALTQSPSQESATPSAPIMMPTSESVGPGAFTDEPEEMSIHHEAESVEQTASKPDVAVEAPLPIASEAPSNGDYFAIPPSLSSTGAFDDPWALEPLKMPAAVDEEAPRAIVEATPDVIPAPEIVVVNPVVQVMTEPQAQVSEPTQQISAPEPQIPEPFHFQQERSAPPIEGHVGMPSEDPFADPVPSILVTNDAHGPSYNQGYHEHVSHMMPSPSLRPSRSIPSINGSHMYHEVDETRPLLSRPLTPILTSYLHSPANPRSSVRFPSPIHSSHEVPRLHDLGWIEYVLPDTTLYYVHPTLRVTTDVDLRHTKKLDAVTAYLDRHKERGSSGKELWLRDCKNKKASFNPIRCWVDHKKRAIVLDTIWEGTGHHGPRKGKHVEEDALDAEYRYWAFMEAYPAHHSLPVSARSEAMDILAWAGTDRLLPSQQVWSSPFTQDEYHELMELLRSFGDNQSGSGLQPVIQTRIIARILLRATQWRQVQFRPERPLPADAHPGHHRPHRRPVRRVLVDFVISCFCLGIPYIFFNRYNQSRLDQESGLRNAAPILVIGASTCLMAAIVLSASVTFLSLPGMDNIARVVGFVAILFASFSMASTLVAILRYKADLERVVGDRMSGEGLMFLTQRSIIMSLPLVFLAYSIIAFVAGITLYSFRGVMLTDPKMIEHHFKDYTRWTVLGVLGGLTGLMATTLLLLRR